MGGMLLCDICVHFWELSKKNYGQLVDHRIVIAEFVGVVVSNSDEKKAPPYME